MSAWCGVADRGVFSTVLGSVTWVVGIGFVTDGRSRERRAECTVDGARAGLRIASCKGTRTCRLEA